MKCARVWLLAGVLSAIGMRAVHADVLLESHVRQRPADAATVLAPFVRALQSAGVLTEAAQIQASAAELLPLPADDKTDFAPRVEAGVTRALRGDFADGLAAMLAVLADVRAHPLVAVTDPQSPTWLTKLYAGIAFAQLRTQGVSMASETLMEELRSFPDRPIGRLLGPEVGGLEGRVRAEATAGPHGTLQIDAGDPSFKIIVNESFRGAGTWQSETVPGSYRVVIVGAHAARRYVVAVAAKQTVKLDVDWEAESAFAVRADWVGFLWDDADRSDAAASRFARMTRAHDLVVASIVTQPKGKYLVGAFFEKQTGALVRRIAVALPAADVCKQALARYLLKGDRAACLVDLLPVPEPRVAAATHDRFVLPGIAAGLGAAAIVVGLSAIASKSDSADGAPGYASALGISFAVGGAAIFAASASWASHVASERGAFSRSYALSYTASITAAASFVAAGYLYSLDGDGTCGQDDRAACRNNYRLKPAAISLGIVGLASTGLAVYWTQRTARTKLVVGAVPTGDGGMATLGGLF